MDNAFISSPNLVFQHDTLHSTSNKALQNATRIGQLLTGHNLKIQLHEILRGQDSKLFQLSDDFKASTEGNVHVLTSRSLGESEESTCLLVKMGQAFNASLVNVQEKKVLKHQHVLAQDVTREEIKHAMFSLKNNKALVQMALTQVSSKECGT